MTSSPYFASSLATVGLDGGIAWPIKVYITTVDAGREDNYGIRGVHLAGLGKSMADTLLDRRRLYWIESTALDFLLAS